MQGGENVKINIQSELKKVDVKSMVPISLIFNELITNSIKHGIKSNIQGEISISVTSNAHITEFNYSDNGIWKTPEKNGTFGLELLDTLTSQLDGSLKRTVKNGTHFVFQFKTETFFYS